MAGKFPGKERILFAHLGLDERMAHAAAVRNAAIFQNDFLHGPRGAQVIENVGPGIFGQHHLGDKRGDHVHGDDVAFFVQKPDAVGIAIEAGGKIILARAHGLLRGHQGVGVERVGFMVGEGAVERVEQRGLLEQAGKGFAFEDAHGVGVIHQHIQGAADIGKRSEMFGVGGQNIVGRDAPLGGGGRAEILFFDDAFQIHDAGGP